MKFLAAVWFWADTAGYQLDCLLNALFLGGERNQTVSLHADRARMQHKAWGCVLCRVLAVLVQPDHCQKQGDGQPESTEAAVRAALAMLFFCAVFYLIVRQFFWLLRNAL
jgi:hypothetical protein